MVYVRLSTWLRMASRRVSRNRIHAGRAPAELPEGAPLEVRDGGATAAELLLDYGFAPRRPEPGPPLPDSPGYLEEQAACAADTSSGGNQV